MITGAIASSRPAPKPAAATPTATTNASRGPRSAGCDANNSSAGSLRCSRRILWPDAQGILPSDCFGAVLKNRMSAVLFWTLCGSVRSAAA